jgi:hypothetical protein
MDRKKNAIDSYGRQEMGCIEAFHNITDVFHFSSVHMFDYPSNHPNGKRTAPVTTAIPTPYSMALLFCKKDNLISYQNQKPIVATAEWYRRDCLVMSTMHLRKLIATLVRENGQRDETVIGKLEDRRA